MTPKIPRAVHRIYNVFVKWSIGILQAPVVYSTYEDISPLVPLIYRLALRGINVCAQNSHGNTCLHLACLRPHAEPLQPHLIRIGTYTLHSMRAVLGVGAGAAPSCHICDPHAEPLQAYLVASTACTDTSTASKHDLISSHLITTR